MELFLGALSAVGRSSFSTYLPMRSVSRLTMSPGRLRPSTVTAAVTVSYTHLTLPTIA